MARLYNHHGLTATQRACMTKLTRDGERDMCNRKPYRTKAQKRTAQKHAELCKDGTYRAFTPLSMHDAPKGQRNG